MNDALVALEQEFAALYAPSGRPSSHRRAVASDALAPSIPFARSGIDGGWSRSAVPLVRGHRRRRRGVGHSVFSRPRRLLEATSRQLLSGLLAHPRGRLGPTILGRRHVDWPGRRWSFRPGGSDAAHGWRRTAGGGFSRRSARTTLTPRRPIQRRGSIARAWQEAKLCFMGMP